jgi:hypothetical protein
MQELEYVEGKNITLELRWAEGKSTGFRPSLPTWFAFGST